MPRKNPQLAERVMQHIEDHPEQHEQASYFCGSSCCFAGWLAVLTGWRQKYTGQFITDGTVSFLFQNIKRGHETDHAFFLTKRELGLTTSETCTLVNGENTPEMLRLIVKDYCNGDEIRNAEDYREEAHQ